VSSKNDTKTISASFARTHWTDVIADASAGIPIVITVHGRPLATIVSARCTPEALAEAIAATKFPHAIPTGGTP